MAGLQLISPMRSTPQRDERRARPEARRRERGLDPGVPAADDEDVVVEAARRMGMRVARLRAGRAHAVGCSR